MESSAQSALVVLVPEAESVVKSFRDRYDHAAAEGVPAHITILYPFKPPHEITPAIVKVLQDIFAHIPAFAFSLAEARRFPELLYLAPTPDAPFKELTRVVAEHFPETPPYGGVHPDIVPHLTVAQVDDSEQLDAIAVEFDRVAQPVQARATEVALMDNEQGRWSVNTTFRLRL